MQALEAGMSTNKSVAHQNPNAAEQQRIAGTVLSNLRALKRTTGILMRHLLISMHESRRTQAVSLIARYGDLIGPYPQVKLLNCDKRIGAAPGESILLTDCCASEGYGFAYGRAGSFY